MAQHFLLSAKARTLSLSQVARMSDDEAYAAFRAVRFADTRGAAVCPKCNFDVCYEFKARRIFKCKACEKQFSLTSGTIFASRKMALRDILLAIAIFVNGANGVSSLRLSRELRCDYKTAFVLTHKLRELLASMRPDRQLTGTVEIDGAWFGGHHKKTNLFKDRKDMRTGSPKRRSIVSLRERRPGGRTLTFVFKSEAQAVATVIEHVDPSASIRADEAAHWNVLRTRFADVKQIKHKELFSLGDGVHTNWVESFNSRLRRAEKGVYHRMAGIYLDQYADELAWREDMRRVSNGVQFSSVVQQAAKRPVSRRMKGYWQRRGPRPPPQRLLRQQQA